MNAIKTRIKQQKELIGEPDHMCLTLFLYFACVIILLHKEDAHSWCKMGQIWHEKVSIKYRVFIFFWLLFSSTTDGAYTLVSQI